MDIQALVENVGYNGKLTELDLNDGAPAMPFVKLVSWLSYELKELCGLESHVSPEIDIDDSLGFLVEISSLLKELCCPYKSLCQGPITDRLNHQKDKILLIEYLCVELQASKIQAHKMPKKREPQMQIELESKTARELADMIISLRLSKPPDTITPAQLFGVVEKKVKGLSEPSTPKERIGDLLFTGCLTEKQWFQLNYLYKEMFEEYKTRRNLLLTRLDVTVKSFLWADRIKAKSEDVLNMYNKKKRGIVLEPRVKISNVLSAKADLAIIEKTSSASVRKNTKCSVNKVVIGAVPDRGGRPEEQQPPPPEVPSWQKNDSSSRGGFKPSNPTYGGNTNYNRDNASYNRDNSGYNRDNAGYNRDNSSYNRDNSGYNRDSAGYNRENASYKNSAYGRDENSNPPRNDGSYKGDVQRNNYRGGKKDYTYTQMPITYQPVNYCAQIGNPQFGFGGYMPAGDNFQQYGMGDGASQMNQYQPRGGHRGSGHRGGSRGGYSDRGSNQSRGGRGQRGGRGRY